MFNRPMEIKIFQIYFLIDERKFVNDGEIHQLSLVK